MDIDELMERYDRYEYLLLGYYFSIIKTPLATADRFDGIKKKISLDEEAINMAEKKKKEFNNILNVLEKNVNDYGFSVQSEDEKLKAMDILFLLSKEKVIGLDNIIYEKEIKSITELLKIFINRISKINDYFWNFEKDTLAPKDLIFSKFRNEDFYLRELNRIIKKWGDYYIPDAFYPEFPSHQKIKLWEKNLINFYLDNGVKEIKKFFNDVGSFLGSFHVDVQIGRYPLSIYSLLDQNRMVGLPVIETKVMLSSTPIRKIKTALSVQIGPNTFTELTFKMGDERIDLPLLRYRYGWGYKSKYAEELFERNKKIRSLFKEIRDDFKTEKDCIKEIAKIFNKSESDIRHIIYARVRFRRIGGSDRDEAYEEDRLNRIEKMTKDLKDKNIENEIIDIIIEDSFTP